MPKKDKKKKKSAYLGSKQPVLPSKPVGRFHSEQATDFSEIRKKSSPISWMRVLALIMSAITITILAATYSMQKSEAKIEKWRAEPRFEATITYSESPDFLSANDKARAVLQSQDSERLINSKTLNVLENQAAGEDIVWLRLENMSADSHAVNTLSTKFWVGGVESDWQGVPVALTLSPNKVLMVPLATVKLVGDPLSYLYASFKFDKVYISTDDPNGGTQIIALPPPPLVPAISVCGAIVITVGIAGFMMWKLKTRKAISRV